MKIIEADLLNSTEKYIIQQCNCLTVYSHGLSKSLSDKWSWADLYSTRSKIGNRNLAIENDRDKPGSIRILTSPNNDKNVICMFAQWVPNKPGKYKSYPKYEIDNYNNREKWFKECLNEILKIDNLESIAIPYMIGCGLAGGNWENYYKLLKEFDDQTNAEVIIYKKT